MLFAALICSLLLIAVAIAAMAHGGCWTAVFIVFGLAFTFAPPILGLVLIPPPYLFFFLLFPVLGRSALGGWRSRATAVVAASVLTVGIISVGVLEDLQDLAWLREKYPMESLEDRLPKKPFASSSFMTEASRKRLDLIEEDLDERHDVVRGRMLKKLHEGTVQLFIDSPGFGSDRVTAIWRPREANLERKLRSNDPIPQPKKSPFAGTARNEPFETKPFDKDQDELHRWKIWEFANQEGFGYVKDLQQVAGFQSHRLSHPPGEMGLWSVANVELVGLLLHPQPVAYVSPHLPNMEELRKAPTRPLDRFESAGLESIRNGEDLFVAETPSGVRMIGAIRSTKQCLKCHEGNRGDLLGAFSYRLEGASK